MKVLIVVHHFPPRYTGGAELRAYRTAAALQSRGHTVRVLCAEPPVTQPASGPAWYDDVYKGLAVRRLSFDPAAAPDPRRWEYDNPWIGEQLHALLVDERPDVMHLFGGYLISGRAFHVAHVSRVPLVVSLTDFWFLCPRITMLRPNGGISTLPLDFAVCAKCMGEDLRRFRWPARIMPGLMDAYWQLQRARADALRCRHEFLLDALCLADVIIAPSQFVASMYVQAGVPPAKVVFMRQGRDFPGVGSPEPVRLSSPVLRVGYVGQTAPHKGVHVLLQAVRTLPGARIAVYVYGDLDQVPGYTAELRRLAGGDARITLAGRVDSKAISAVYRGLDLLVVPSVWYENSPNVILEAFAHHTPVLASNLGGMAELVEPGKNGLLFEVGSAADLARQLRRLLDEPGLLATLRAGIGPVKSAGQEIDELEAVYATVGQVSLPIRSGMP